VKIVRDGTIATTWLLRRNAANTDYELVYLFDGEPGAISANGRSFGINGAGSDPSRFVTERSTLGTFDNYNAYSRPGIDFIAVSRDGLAAVHRSDSAAVAGYFSFMRRPLEELFIDELPQVDGLTVTPISRDDVTADILASITTADGPQAVLFSPTSHFDGPLIWSVTKPTTQDWRHSPDFHTKSETTRRLAIGAFGRIYALHDGSLFSLSHLRLANVGAPEVDPSQILATTPIGESGSVIVGRSDLGEILYYRRENEAAQWKVIAFSPNSVSSWFDFTTVHGAVAWGDGAALATDRGVIQLARKADGTWDAVNIADLFSKDLPTITRGFGLIRDNDGYIYLTGLTDANELIYFHSRSPNPDINTLWTTANLTREVREAFGVADLDLRGDLVTYVTPWNGLNIAGLNLDGEPVVYWTAPGLDGWRFTNLAQSQEDLTLARGLERLAVNVLPWGGIGLTDADSSLRTVWWAPGLGGFWKFVALADVVQDSARPVLVKESIIGFSTACVGQNIIGVDAQGHLWVYWWSPQSDKWQADSLQSGVSSLKDRVFTTRLSAYAVNSAIAMAVTAADADHHAIQLYFKVGTCWLTTGPTAEVEQA